MQGLMVAATFGVGYFFGSQAGGFVMDYFSVQGKFQWRKIWAVPLVIMLASVITMAAVFKGEVRKPEQKPEPKAVSCCPLPSTASRCPERAG